MLFEFHADNIQLRHDYNTILKVKPLGIIVVEGFHSLQNKGRSLSVTKVKEAGPGHRICSSSNKSEQETAKQTKQKTAAVAVKQYQHDA